MYIILTSKLGEYDARPGQGISPVEAYEYFFYGKKKADFTIAEVDGDQGRVSIVEAGEGGTTNSVPLKFFERFDTVEAADLLVLEETTAEQQRFLDEHTLMRISNGIEVTFLGPYADIPALTIGS